MDRSSGGHVVRASPDLDPGRGSVFPDSDASGGFLWWWNHRGTLLGANDDFFIVGRTPFELVFHPR